VQKEKRAGRLAIVNSTLRKEGVEKVFILFKKRPTGPVERFFRPAAYINSVQRKGVKVGTKSRSSGTLLQSEGERNDGRGRCRIRGGEVGLGEVRTRKWVQPGYILSDFG